MEKWLNWIPTCICEFWGQFPTKKLSGMLRKISEPKVNLETELKKAACAKEYLWCMESFKLNVFPHMISGK